jgi:hypothetical protein
MHQTAVTDLVLFASFVRGFQRLSEAFRWQFNLSCSPSVTMHILSVSSASRLYLMYIVRISARSGSTAPSKGRTDFLNLNVKTFRYGFVDLRSSHFAGEEPRVGISRGLGHFLRSYVSVLLVDSAGWWTGKSRGARRS